MRHAECRPADTSAAGTLRRPCRSPSSRSTSTPCSTLAPTSACAGRRSRWRRSCSCAWPPPRSSDAGAACARTTSCTSRSAPRPVRVIGGRIGYALTVPEAFATGPLSLFDPSIGGLELSLAVVGGLGHGGDRRGAARGSRGAMGPRRHDPAAGGDRGREADHGPGRQRAGASVRRGLGDRLSRSRALGVPRPRPCRRIRRRSTRRSARSSSALLVLVASSLGLFRSAGRTTAAGRARGLVRRPRGGLGDVAGSRRRRQPPSGRPDRDRRRYRGCCRRRRAVGVVAASGAGPGRGRPAELAGSGDAPTVLTGVPRPAVAPCASPADMRRGWQLVADRVSWRG